MGCPTGTTPKSPTRGLKMYAYGLTRYLMYGCVGGGGWVASKCEEDGKVGRKRLGVGEWGK
jgi:hypothetical protein